MGCGGSREFGTTSKFCPRKRKGTQSRRRRKSGCVGRLLARLSHKAPFPLILTFSLGEKGYFIGPDSHSPSLPQSSVGLKSTQGTLARRKRAVLVRSRFTRCSSSSSGATVA